MAEVHERVHAARRAGKGADPIAAVAGELEGTIERLVILLGSGGNTLSVNGTHGGATPGFQETTTVDTGSGADVLHINDATDVLVVNGQPGGDTFNVNGTSGGSTVTNTQAYTL